MLYTRKLLAELERRRDLFAGYAERYGRQLQAYRGALGALGARFASAEALAAAQRGEGAPVALGARPTAEYDRWRRAGTRGMPALPFGRAFAHHEEARAWAECVRGTTTFAVDGSQLMPWKEASVPVALVQAGLFENPHQPPEPYIKDVEVELLSPDDLVGQEMETVETRTGQVLGYSEQIVHLRRFELEMRTLAARMGHHAGHHAGRQSAGRGAGPPVVAFYDGSLIVSFALKMPPPYRDRYVAAVGQVLAASEACGVPLVGYVDTSYARDIITLLRGLADVAGRDGPLPEPRGVHDALLWQGSLAWGDRTPAFLSARDDLARMGYTEQQGAVAFVYYQAAVDRPPARLEFPRWVLEAGLLDHVMEVVRAETIVGNGYPYPIEAADAVAVISQSDRAQFYALFQDFAERAGLGFSVSRKAVSKRRRRV